MHPTALNVETLDSFLLELQSIPQHCSADYRNVTPIAADVKKAVLTLTLLQVCCAIDQILCSLSKADVFAAWSGE